MGKVIIPQLPVFSEYYLYYKRTKKEFKYVLSLNSLFVFIYSSNLYAIHITKSNAGIYSFMFYSFFKIRTVTMGSVVILLKT